jgi:adenine-specific DNA-methyltransferase
MKQKTLSTSGRTKRAKVPSRATTYKHSEAVTPLRPEVGTQAQFKKKKEPHAYLYDSSLSPVMEWDAKNPAREQGEQHIGDARRRASEVRTLLAKLKKIETNALTKADAENLKKAIAEIELSSKAGSDSLDRLKALSSPFLNWSGKAEHLRFDVPTLPLFIHERLSTTAIIETLHGHKSDKQDDFLSNLFADPRHSVADQVLRAYEYKDDWVNRLILGDSLVVMNSLLHYESLGGQVQMIYVDPPYGVKFGSNFQPFVRTKPDGSTARDVKHNEDEDFTREPEMVQAYRDTWELGLHSYLTYMRDRLLLCRELLTPSGSIFVQISDENLHHVRELLDEVFGAENFVSIIAFTKAAGGLESVERVGSRLDYLVWYAKDIERIKYRALFEKRTDAIESGFDMIELPDGTRRRLTAEERKLQVPVPEGSRLFMSVLMTKPGPGSKFEVEFEGRKYEPGRRWWGTTKEGIQEVIRQKRVIATENSLRFVKYLDDFQFKSLSNLWDGLGGAADPIYVVQTSPEVVKRCLLMTTDPGDLVVDPTCGSGTTAYVAEQWGRRWITMDTSRVPLALARQRLLTATFPYYALKDEARGPAGGFVYQRKQNAKGEEVGGIVPHVTLKSIANHEPPAEEVLVDRPETVNRLVRVSGPLTVEATIPTPVEFETTESPSPQPSPSKGEGEVPSPRLRGEGQGEGHAEFIDRMLEVLRKSPVLRLEGNRTVTLKNLRPPAKTLSLSAEAMIEENPKSEIRNPKSNPVAFVFGPENGAVSEKLVYEAAREAHAKNYTHLYVIGFAIQPNARELVEKSAEVIGVPATYVQATPDLMMGDLLKNMRSSQIFSVCGLPEIEVRRMKDEGRRMKKEGEHYQVELLGMDVFDPVSMEAEHHAGNDVPCWMLDSDYNGLCFRATQVFFPRTSAWENLKKALKGSYEETVWDHLAGTTSAPFEAGTHGQVAVKVIDDRGNELLVVKSLKEAEAC